MVRMRAGFSEREREAGKRDDREDDREDKRKDTYLVL